MDSSTLSEIRICFKLIMAQWYHMVREIFVNFGSGNSITQQPITWTKVDLFNSSWPSDVVCQRRSLLTLVRVIAWCRLGNLYFFTWTKADTFKWTPLLLVKFINIETFSLGNFIWKCHLEHVGHLFRPLCVSFQIEATSFCHTCKLGDAHFPPPPGAVSGLESLLQHLWQK